MNYQAILDAIAQEIEPLFYKGKVADYIPALANVNPEQFAMSLHLINGESYHVGCAQTKFSIQSISKVFTFTMALQAYGAKLYERIGVEPSGNPFNSLVQLEYEAGIPRNPFINAGAIVVTDALRSIHGNHNETFNAILRFIQTISHEENITFDKEVVESEIAHGYRNLALASMMKSFENLIQEPENILKTYFQHCAITMNTQELAQAISFLANQGVSPLTNERITTIARARRINAVMLTCGHYDASGEFAFNVGLPAKSGVGGGIVAVVPGIMGIAVFAPELNQFGNSLIGTKALELFSNKTGHSIF